eukprot:gnl/MRDRNA2_/MRDRNA2_27735_c0_seq1.p1 gnl/MRDRNA2_/MRDRNA2_27735_c0~~gnl/MRDRNA2_/MRDRNA2_27735_c0_seq1.p1  ORF type:complete len:1356 (-),score=316.86 gnl/MRDRNA2_/MRDRNA2_27735_c0_seq1:316-4383(-)
MAAGCAALLCSQEGCGTRCVDSFRGFHGRSAVSPNRNAPLSEAPLLFPAVGGGSDSRRVQAKIESSREDASRSTKVQQYADHPMQFEGYEPNQAEEAYCQEQLATAEQQCEPMEEDAGLEFAMRRSEIKAEPGSEIGSDSWFVKLSPVQLEVAIWKACTHGSCELLEKCVQHGASTDITDKRTEKTLAYLVACSGDVDCMKLLLQKDKEEGGKLNIDVKEKRTTFGYTCLMAAAWYGHRNMCDYLVDQLKCPLQCMLGKTNQLLMWLEFLAELQSHEQTCVALNMDAQMLLEEDGQAFRMRRYDLRNWIRGRLGSTSKTKLKGDVEKPTPPNRRWALRSDTDGKTRSFNPKQAVGKLVKRLSMLYDSATGEGYFRKAQQGRRDAYAPVDASSVAGYDVPAHGNGASAGRRCSVEILAGVTDSDTAAFTSAVDHGNPSKITDSSPSPSEKRVSSKALRSSKLSRDSRTSADEISESDSDNMDEDFDDEQFERQAAVYMKVGPRAATTQPVRRQHFEWNCGTCGHGNTTIATPRADGNGNLSRVFHCEKCNDENVIVLEVASNDQRRHSDLGGRWWNPNDQDDAWEEELEQREDVLDTVKLFSTLDEGERYTVATNMGKKEFPLSSVIVEEGTPGEEVYILVQGCVDVSQNGIVLASLEADWANHKSLHVVGERAFLAEEPRGATVKATTMCTVYAIDKATFQAVMGRLGENVRTEKNITFLGKMELMRCLSMDEQRVIASKSKEVRFMTGDQFMVEGEIPTQIFVLIEGEVSLTDRGRLIKNFVACREKRQSHEFAEQAVLTEAKAQVTVTVFSEYAICLAISREDLEACLESTISEIHQSVEANRVLLKFQGINELSAEHKRQIAKQMVDVHLRKNTMLFREGQSMDSIFILMDGCVELRTAGDPNATQLRKADPQALDYHTFGEQGMYTDEVHEFSAVVVSAEARLWRLDKAQMVEHIGLLKLVMAKNWQRQLKDVDGEKAAPRKKAAWITSGNSKQAPLTQAKENLKKLANRDSPDVVTDLIGFKQQRIAIVPEDVTTASRKEADHLSDMQVSEVEKARLILKPGHAAKEDEMYLFSSVKHATIEDQLQRRIHKIWYEHGISPSSEIELKCVDGELVTAFVKSGSHAELSGLRKGFVLMAVNNDMERFRGKSPRTVLETVGHAKRPSMIFFNPRNRAAAARSRQPKEIVLKSKMLKSKAMESKEKASQETEAKPRAKGTITAITTVIQDPEFAKRYTAARNVEARNGFKTAWAQAVQDELAEAKKPKKKVKTSSSSSKAAALTMNPDDSKPVRLTEITDTVTDTDPAADAVASPRMGECDGNRSPRSPGIQRRFKGFTPNYSNKKIRRKEGDE